MERQPNKVRWLVLIVIAVAVALAGSQVVSFGGANQNAGNHIRVNVNGVQADEEDDIVWETAEPWSGSTPTVDLAIWTQEPVDP